MDYLREGSSGPAVKTLQYLLNFHLDGTGVIPLKIDSIFGHKTKAAVVKFQQLNGLSMDGIVGPKTRAALLHARYVTAQVAMAQHVDGGERDWSGVAPAIMRARHRKGPLMANFLPVLLASDNSGQSPGRSQGQSPPPSVVETTVVVQTGQQANINPWFVSPFVFTLQATSWSRATAAGRFSSVRGSSCS